MSGDAILRQVRQLGDPGLRRPSSEVADGAGSDAFAQRATRLHEALSAFRARHGFGRAISAPQLGMNERFIACNLGDGPFTLIDPVITWRSEERVTLWDDCMSFPGLLVRLRRHASIGIRWRDAAGARHALKRLDTATSELLQHEMDHLDGVLAVDRALGANSLVLRPVFEAQRERFAAMVDHITG